jgi:hypothetical protein
MEKSEILEINEYELSYMNIQSDKAELNGIVIFIKIEFPCKQCFSDNSIKIKKVIILNFV